MKGVGIKWPPQPWRVSILYCSVAHATVNQYSSPMVFMVLQQQKKYQKIKSATVVMQSFIRGWKVRAMMIMMYIVSAPRHQSQWNFCMATYQSHKDLSVT